MPPMSSRPYETSLDSIAADVRVLSNLVSVQFHKYVYMPDRPVVIPEIPRAQTAATRAGMTAVKPAWAAKVRHCLAVQASLRRARIFASPLRKGGIGTVR